MTAIRFDADENARVTDNADLLGESEDPLLNPEWGPLDEVIWYLTDGQSNGRWLAVGHPDREGSVPLAIQRVYVKFLSPEAARDLAAALVEAADAGAAIQAETNAEREAQTQLERACEAESGHEWGPPPMTVRHATAVLHSDGTSQSFRVCRRCGDARWLEDDPSCGWGVVLQTGRGSAPPTI